MIGAEKWKGGALSIASPPGAVAYPDTRCLNSLYRHLRQEAVVVTVAGERVRDEAQVADEQPEEGDAKGEDPLL